MPTLRLTKTAIESARPEKSDYELRDSVVPGFLCKVTPSGRKVFMLSYRTVGGNRRKPAIGQFGELTVEQARKLAQDWQALVRAGGDPSLDKTRARTNPTIKEFCGQFIEQYSIPHNKPSTVLRNRQNIKKHIIPALGKIKVADLTRPDVAALMMQLAHTPGAANTTLACLKKMFNCAELWGYRTDGTNPCRLIPRYASAEYGNFNTFNGEMGANLALSDSFAVRASGVFLTHDGYRKLTGPAKEGDDENFASGRIQARFRSGGFEAWVSYQHDSRDVNGEAQLKTPLGGGLPDLDHPPSFYSTAPTKTTLEGDRVRWELAYSELGPLNLTYSGGYDTQKWSNAIDATDAAYPATRNFIQKENPKTWNHEFRINNEKSSRLFFQAGYFHFEETNAIDTGLLNLMMTGDFAPGGSLAGLPNADQSNQYPLHFNYDVKTRSDAVFGQVEYRLSEQLSFSLGGRYTWDKKERTGQAVLMLPALVYPLCANSYPDAGSCSPLPQVTPDQGKMSEGQPTWHVGLNYHPNPDSLIYAKYDRGYKSGGFNTNGTGPSLPYGPEKLDAFEIGSKNSLLGGSLKANLSAFYFDYRGYQASQSTSVISSGSGRFNVGKARIYGLEGELVALLGRATRVNLNASYLNAKFGSGISVRNDAGDDIEIGGNQLPNAPKFTANVGIEQDVDAAGGQLTARVDGKYSSSFYYSVFNDVDTRSPSYFLANASVSYKPDNGPWKIQAYVRNILDKNVLAFAQLNFTGGTNTYQFQPPRTYGVRASVSF